MSNEQDSQVTASELAPDGAEMAAVVEPEAPAVVPPVEATHPAAVEAVAAPAPKEVPADASEAVPAIQPAGEAVVVVAGESQAPGAGVAAAPASVAAPVEKPKKVYQAPVGVSVSPRTVVVGGELREMPHSDQIQLPWMEQA